MDRNVTYDLSGQQTNGTDWAKMLVNWQQCHALTLWSTNQWNWLQNCWWIDRKNYTWTSVVLVCDTRIFVCSLTRTILMHTAIISILKASWFASELCNVTCLAPLALKISRRQEELLPSHLQSLWSSRASMLPSRKHWWPYTLDECILQPTFMTNRHTCEM